MGCKTEAEAWAQFGRIYYSNDTNVSNVRIMPTALFSSFEGEAVSILKGL